MKMTSLFVGIFLLVVACGQKDILLSVENPPHVVSQENVLMTQLWRDPVSEVRREEKHAVAPGLPKKGECPLTERDFTLSKQGNDFVPENAYWAMWLSKTIQLDEALIWEKLLAVPLEDSHLIRRARLGLQAGVFRISGQVYVVFRGTQDKADYIRNALFDSVSGKSIGVPGRVHRGFRDGFADLWSEVSQAATSMGAAENGVWVMGHSLGGVLSVFAAYNFVEAKVPVYGVFGFGSPLPGDKVFQKAYNARLERKTFQVGFESDITPHVPPIPEAANSFAKTVHLGLRTIVRNVAQRLNYAQVGQILP
jgi:hypothetical protein